MWLLLKQMYFKSNDCNNKYLIFVNYVYNLKCFYVLENQFIRCSKNFNKMFQHLLFTKQLPKENTILQNK